VTSVLVTGGAGYVGCHLVRLLRERGMRVLVLDDLSTGHAESVGAEDFVEGDIGDTATVSRILRENSVDVIYHMAACALVEESVARPAKYYERNISAGLSVVKAALDAGSGKFVFSSSAAVYGVPSTIPIGESAPRRPVNPYGRSKAIFEDILADCAEAYGIAAVALRYFNAAGAWPDGSIGEDHNPETHLIPNVLRVAMELQSMFKIQGTDYPTPDGSCVRDFIHVCDLAEAHILATEKLEKGRLKVFNLGNERPVSVREVVRVAGNVTGKEIPVVEEARRPGDPPALVASAGKAREELGWKPKFTELEQIIETAWNWHSSHPEGYKRRR